MITTVLAIAFALALLIGFHEYGHYRVAKACGVKVLRFSLGFGRVIARWKPAETEFTISAIPLGGYVRMLDERDPDSGPVAPEERHRAFNNRPLLQRIAIVAAGPLANLSLAALLFAITAWIGSEEPRALLGTPAAGSLAAVAGIQPGDLVTASRVDGGESSDVRSLSQLQGRLLEAAMDGETLWLQVSDASGHGRRELRLDTASLAGKELDADAARTLSLRPWMEPRIQDVSPGSAAEQAGLKAGDRVLSLDGVAQSDESGVRERILAAVDGEQARKMRWVVERAGQTLELDVTPRVIEEGGKRVPRVGVLFRNSIQMAEVRYGFGEGLAYGLRRTWEMASLTVRMIGRMLVGKASVKNISGPITMAEYAGHAAQAGLVVYIGYLALISVSLGVLNLLPLPMLDGGMLMYYLFEGLSGRPVSERWQQQLQRVGVVVLLLMMGLALFNDVTRQFLH
ncbi:MAG: RIP metalloprotease RseP [Paucibacter sp.]|nr:RIP metalloprotease RseP [Roseateles sp.]